MNIYWKTETDRFRLVPCAELPSETFPDGREVLEIRDEKDGLVRLADVFDGSLLVEEAERREIEPTADHVARIGRWAAKGAGFILTRD